MITLTDLRALLVRALTHAANPAIVRLTDRTVEGMARAYLPRTSWVLAPTRRVETVTLLESAAWGEMEDHTRPPDLTDPGTAHALLVALALALGLDPGVGGLGCMWSRVCNGWAITSLPCERQFFMSSEALDWVSVRHEAPTTAAEPDPIKALALAVRHVLEQP